MDKFLKNQLYKWTYDKLKSNPNKFGTDDCNPLFMQKYLEEHYNIFLPISVIKSMNTVSRIKSKILLNNPQWDFRQRDKPKTKKK